MAKLDGNKTSITNMSEEVKSWSVDSGIIDEAGGENERTWSYPDADANLGYYQQLPEFKKAVDILAMYTTGKGVFSPSSRTTQQLLRITGWGEDTIESILWNLLVQKKVFGDAFAEIIRDDAGQLINLKTLYTGDMTVVTNDQGLIVRYEQSAGAKTPNKTFTPDKIFHLVNERIANSIHGTSALDSVKWVIDAKNEALDTMRKIQRRQLAVGIMKLDTEDEDKIAEIKKKYQEATNSGEVLVLQKGVAEIEQAPANQVIGVLLQWIQYLDDFSYRALGVPLVLAGGSGGSEGSDKTGFLTFDQVWGKEQRELIADFWNQVAMRITLAEPASINPNVTENEGKNTSQTGFQNKEVTATAERE